MTIAAAVLAAGRGARLAGEDPKPLRTLAGVPMVDRALRSALDSGLRPVLLVVGHEADAVAARASVVAGAGSDDPILVVRNDRWATGIASSLAAALDALTPRRAVDAVVVALADQPLVGAGAYRRLAAAYDDGARLGAATYGGERAHPVLLARTHWAEARALSGDEGARVLMARRGVRLVPCDGTGTPDDVDTTDDLAAMEARCASTTRSE